MFSITSVLSLALAVSSVVGSAIPLHHRAMYRSNDLERRWYSSNGDLLEPYEIYHQRYLRLDCEAKHNTSFFASCCHPFLKTQSEKDLPAMCNATSTSAPSSTFALPTASASGFSFSAAPAASSAAASSAPSDNNGDDGDCDENDPNCECSDGDDGDGEPTISYYSWGSYYSYSSAPTASAAANAQDAPGSTSTWYQSSSAADPQYTPSSAAAAANSESTPGGDSSSGSGSGASQSSGQVETGGFATYFYQNGNAGACGEYNSDSSYIAAIDVAWYGNTGVTSPLCGQQVEITNTQNGNTVTVTIEDACPTCDNGNSIDLSVAAFEALANLSEGLVPITWKFV